MKTCQIQYYSKAELLVLMIVWGVLIVMGVRVDIFSE